MPAATELRSGDPVVAALRADGRDHRHLYVADHGFTARVVAALPAPETVPAWRKPALIALWALTGVGAALALPGAFADDPLSLLALDLDGDPLSLDHGYPCRLIAPSRPGVLQTKWVRRIEVLS